MKQSRPNPMLTSLWVWCLKWRTSEWNWNNEVDNVALFTLFPFNAKSPSIEHDVKLRSLYCMTLGRQNNFFLLISITSFFASKVITVLPLQYKPKRSKVTINEIIIIFVNKLIGIISHMSSNMQKENKPQQYIRRFSRKMRRLFVNVRINGDNSFEAVIGIFSSSLFECII